MRLRYMRRVGAGLVVASATTILALLPTAAPAMASAALYVGGGRGPTPEAAIEAAIWDAEQSALGDGRLDCELVDEPRVGRIEGTPDRPAGPVFRFRASVDMICR